MAPKHGPDTYDPVLGAIARFHRNRKLKEKKRAARQRKDEEWEEMTRAVQERMEMARLVQLQMQSELDEAIFRREVEREAKRAEHVLIRALAACFMLGLVGLGLWLLFFSLIFRDK